MLLARSIKFGIFLGITLPAVSLCFVDDEKFIYGELLDVYLISVLLAVPGCSLLGYIFLILRRK